MTVSISTLSRAVVLLTVVVIVFFLLLPSGVGAGDEAHPTRVHVIQPGETLWSIAGQHTPAGGDVRATVYALKQMNGLQGGAIRAGAELVVPLGS